jgi:hydrogenase nickel incorporation protein HypA/HybF
MHELTVATNILAIVASEAGKAGVQRVKEVCLEIGQLSGIEYESLEFALTALSPDSVMQGAILTIEKPGGRARCSTCSFEFSFESFLGSCSSCGSSDIEISGGRELRVKSISI